MSSARTRNVPRVANLIDLGGMALLMIGGGLYLRAFIGMSALRASTGAVASKARWAGLAEYERLWELSRVGLWVGVASGAVLVASAVIAWRARHRTPVAEPAAQAVAL